NINTLLFAIKIVFTNIIAFGDTFWKQISGTGIGISQAPPWATIFFALHEGSLLPRWSRHILFHKRFIDNVISIWIPHPCSLPNKLLRNEFQQEIQQWYGLEWTFTALSVTS
ncbi:hypothetical protein ACHAW6_007378, partial [Cyclotella cf. meneghiniana]